jgi:hypothetical protein
VVAEAGGALSNYAVNPALGNGAIDIAATPDGEFLYVQNGATATVHIYYVEADIVAL